jgi:replicative DNA helicase
MREDEGITWDVPCIDERVIPMRAGELVSIISRPGHGKTSLMARMARIEAQRLQEKHGGPPYPEAVVYCTWEQSAEELNAMFQASEDFTISDIAWGRAPIDTIRKQSVKRASLPIWVVGHGIGRAHHKAPRLTPDVVLKAIESMEVDFDIKPTLVLFDYLQLIPSKNYRDRVQQVTEMPIQIKELALRIGCPAFCGVQAARRVDDRDDKVPEMRDAQWASSIEQTSDKIFGACRPIRYSPAGGLVKLDGHGEVNVSENLLILRLLKQRGDSGRHTWPLYFDPATLKLMEMEIHQSPDDLPL